MSWVRSPFLGAPNLRIKHICHSWGLSLGKGPCDRPWSITWERRLFPSTPNLIIRALTHSWVIYSFYKEGHMVQGHNHYPYVLEVFPLGNKPLYFIIESLMVQGYPSLMWQTPRLRPYPNPRPMILLREIIIWYRD